MKIKSISTAFVIILFLIISIGQVKGEDSDSFIFKQGVNFTLSIPMANADLSPCTTCSCSMSIFYPNGSVMERNVNGVNNGGYCEYTTKTDISGEYGAEMLFNNGADYGRTTFKFLVTPTGKEFTMAKSILYDGILALLVLFFIFNFFIIGKLPHENNRNPEGQIISLSYLKYLRKSMWFFQWIILISIFFIASNLAFAYLGNELVAKFFFVIFHIFLLITPIILIIWFISFFVEIQKDKELKKLFERGFYPESI